MIAALVAFAAYVLVVTDGMYFLGDDWGLLQQGQRWAGLIEPYNDHLSVSIIGIYRGSVEVFGLSYTPLRIIALVCFLAIPAAFYVTTRSRLSPVLAAAGAVVIIAGPRFEIQPATLNHYLVGLGAVICAWALRDGHTGWLAGGLCLALTGAAGGVAVAVGCVVHCACTRPPRARWIAVAVPCAVWGLWWLMRSEGSGYQPAEDPTFGEFVRYARNVATAPFDYWLLDLLLIAAFLAIGTISVRRGLREGATWLAWTSALLVWACGVAAQRGARGTVDVLGRYQLLGTIFVVLALVPTRPLRLKAERAALAALVAACVLAGAHVARDISPRADRMTALGETGRCLLAEGTLGAPPVATVDQVNELRDRYGSPAPCP